MTNCSRAIGLNWCKMKKQIIKKVTRTFLTRIADMTGARTVSKLKVPFNKCQMKSDGSGEVYLYFDPKDLKVETTERGRR